MYFRYAKMAGFVMGLAMTTGTFAETPVGTQLSNVNYAGSGCPVHTISVKLTPATDELKVELDDFVLQTRLDLPFGYQRKTCHLSVALKVPPGWSYSLSEVSYTAFANLTAGAVGLFRSSYYFQGSQAVARFEAKISGPINYDQFTVRDTIGTAALVWSPCGVQRSLNLNTEGRIDTSRSRNRQFDNIITIEESPMAHVYKLVWRRC